VYGAEVDTATKPSNVARLRTVHGATVTRCGGQQHGGLARAPPDEQQQRQQQHGTVDPGQDRQPAEDPGRRGGTERQVTATRVAPAPARRPAAAVAGQDGQERAEDERGERGLAEQRRPDDELRRAQRRDGQSSERGPRPPQAQREQAGQRHDEPCPAAR
jgi:hypothetical protein